MPVQTGTAAIRQVFGMGEQFDATSAKDLDRGRLAGRAERRADVEREA